MADFFNDLDENRGRLRIKKQRNAGQRQNRRRKGQVSDFRSDRIAIAQGGHGQREMIVECIDERRAVSGAVWVEAMERIDFLERHEVRLLVQDRIGKCLDAFWVVVVRHVY